MSINKIVVLCVFVLGGLLSVHVVAAVKNNHQYTLSFSDSLKYVKVETCFANSSPSRLEPYHRSIVKNISSAILISNNHQSRLEIDSSGIRLPAIDRGDCIQYRVRFNRQITHPWFTNRQSTARQIMVEINQLLLWPNDFEPQQDVIDIRVDSGSMQFSAPWKQIASNNNYHQYQTSNRPIDWEGRLVVGEFSQRKRTIGQSSIDIAVLNGRGQQNDKDLFVWVNHNLDALQMAYGKFPVKNLQVLIVPIGRDREPVPWGHVMRGGGNGVHMYVDETRPLDEFLDDWVLVHELSHLLHPVMRGRDHWFSEGLASYYQNVLRARAGLMTEYNAWDRLHKGFVRGVRGSPQGMTLAQASENMMAKGLFMRVYWSGAAIGLLADVELRKQSNGQQSLDTALEALNKCCLRRGELWSSEQVMNRLDAITKTTIFSKLYWQYIDSDQFPRLAKLYQQLGLKADGYSIRLDNSSAGAQLRKKIMVVEPGARRH